MKPMSYNWCILKNSHEVSIEGDAFIICTHKLIVLKFMDAKDISIVRADHIAK